MPPRKQTPKTEQVTSISEPQTSETSTRVSTETRKELKFTPTRKTIAGNTYEYVTSYNLRRKVIPNSKKCTIYLSEDDYLALGMEGMKHKVTFDEVIRAAIDMLLTSSDPTSSLRNYLPA